MFDVNLINSFILKRAHQINSIKQKKRGHLIKITNILQKKRNECTRLMAFCIKAGCKCTLTQIHSQTHYTTTEIHTRSTFLSDKKKRPFTRNKILEQQNELRESKKQNKKICINNSLFHVLDKQLQTES